MGLYPSAGGDELVKRQSSPTVGEINPLDHVEWAKRKIARKVRKRYRFLSDSAEQDDLESVAIVTLYTKVKDFDYSMVPAGGDVVEYFRGWMHQWILSECVREARRLRNGGTYHTRREVRGAALVAEPLGHAAEMEIDEPYRDDADEDEREYDLPPPKSAERQQTFPRHCANPECGRRFRGPLNRRFCSSQCEQDAAL